MEIVPVPAQKGTEEETFSVLCSDVSLDKEVLKFGAWFYIADAKQ